MAIRPFEAARAARGAGLSASSYQPRPCQPAPAPSSNGDRLDPQPDPIPEAAEGLRTRETAPGQPTPVKPWTEDSSAVPFIRPGA